ncbi:hypothetical protein [Xanthomonas phage RTH11]|nr:hypothetical protein [Xanthomonas phage RTH11]
MFNISGRDFLMAIVGALLLTIVTAVQGCKQVPPSEREGTGKVVSPSAPAEENVTRISRNITRTEDKEKNVVCYNYDNPRSLHHSLSCLKD